MTVYLDQIFPSRKDIAIDLPSIRIPLEQTSLSIYKTNAYTEGRNSELLRNHPLLLLLGETSHSNQRGREARSHHNN